MKLWTLFLIKLMPFYCMHDTYMTARLSTDALFHTKFGILLVVLASIFIVPAIFPVHKLFCVELQSQFTLAIILLQVLVGIRCSH